MGSFVVKKIVAFFGIMMFLCGAVFAQDVSDAVSDFEDVAEDAGEAVEEIIDGIIETYVPTEIEIEEEESKPVTASKAGYADVPDSKRPKAPDPEKIEEAAKKDENEKTFGENQRTLKYGIASEINKLIDTLVSNEDPRFVDDLYDLFQVTKSTEVKEKILNYFKKLEDPCLEDYAVMVLNDPYDEKNSTVKACFQYVSAVKCTAAAPAVLLLIENENEDYFNDALLAIGDIGGAEEALFLAEYLERSDLTTVQKQSLMKVLGKIHAVETWDSLVEIAEDEDENLFVRMYAAEAIGAMEKEESVPVLQHLFEASDPNLRQYVVKGLSYFPENDGAKETIIQAVRDDHYKVRLEAIDAVKKFEYKEAIPYLIYRAQNDSETKVKQNSYDVIAFLNTDEGNDFLIERVQDKKTGDALRTRAVEALLKEGHVGVNEIKEVALQVATDDTRKSLRTSLGKAISKNPRDEFGEVCIKYLESKDTTTQGLGLDMYQNGKYEEAIPYLQKIVDDKKANTSNKNRAKKLLGIDEEEKKTETEKGSELETSKSSGNEEDAK